MQAKRIFSLLVVVVLTILCGITSVGAQDNALIFEYAVEVSSSTAVAEDPCLTVKPGDIIDVSVTVTSNPGIKIMKFAVVYDANAVEPVLDTNNELSYDYDGMFGNATPKVGYDSNNPGKVTFFCDATGSVIDDITATGTVITFKFKVADGFHGSTGFALAGSEDPEYDFAENIGGGEIFGIFFDEKRSNDANTEGYTKATVCSHNYGAPVSADATCTTPATTTYTCTAEGCPDNTLVIVTAPALGHTVVVDPAVEPTYSKEGLTEGQHCSVCGEVIVAQQSIPKKSSLWIWLVSIGGVLVVGAAGFGVYWFVIKKNPLPFGLGKKDAPKKDTKAPKTDKKPTKEKKAPKEKNKK